MVSGSEVRAAYPSVSFFFARLGAALSVSGDFFPLVGDFIFVGCGLSLVIGELSPILGQSLTWFEGETRRMAKVRSSELDTGLSSTGDLEGGDTAFSTPRVVRAFHALEEVCGLDDETVSRFKDRFQFPERSVFVSPLTRIGPVISFSMKSASMRMPLLAGLGSRPPIHNGALRFL